MKTIFLGLALMISLSTFASSSVISVGESVPFLRIEASSQEECQAKLSEVNKKLTGKIILAKQTCKLLHEADDLGEATYTASIMFY